MIWVAQIADFPPTYISEIVENELEVGQNVSALPFSLRPDWAPFGATLSQISSNETTKTSYDGQTLMISGAGGWRKARGKADDARLSSGFRIFKQWFLKTKQALFPFKEVWRY